LLSSNTLRFGKLRALLPRSFFASILLFPLVAFAGGAIPAPPTPGAVQDSLPQRRAPDISTPAQVIFYDDPVEIDAQPEAKRFLVSGFNYAGNTVVDNSVLQRITERFLDLQLTLAELDQAAANITAYYRSRGYTVARAFIPAQRIEDGLVTIQIIEGHLEAVTFKGQGWYREKFLQSYIDSFTVGEHGEVVTDASLERRMLLLNDLPGLRARATLVPGERFGTTSIDIDVTEKLFGAYLGYSNSGTEETGENRADIGVEINNPLTLGDQLFLRAIHSTDNLFRYEQIAYSIPIGYDGWKLGVSALNTEYKLGGEFESLDISGRVKSHDLTLSYPFVRSRSKNIIGALQYRKTTTRQYVFDLPFSEASLPLTTASVYYNHIADDSSATAINLAYTTNFWYHGDDSRQEHVSSKLDAGITYLTGATRNWDFLFRGQGVYSSAELPDTEKFSLGGAESVRGYPSAQIRGDKGYLVSMELRRQWRVASIPGYFSAFVDTGGVNNKGFNGYDRISSAGLGLVFFVGNYGRFKLEYAKPISDEDARDDKSDRVWFNMSVSY
jgi:hemolysin activation/secretion protein